MVESAQAGAGNVRYVLTPAQQAVIQQACERLRSLARSIAKEQRASEEDLYQQAVEIACRRIGGYNPQRGTFLDYIYQTVKWELRDACVRDARERAMQRSIQRAMASIAEHLETGDILTESPQERHERFENARFALAGAAVVATVAIPINPEEQYMSAEEHARARQHVVGALHQLAREDRELVVRHIIEEKSLAEAAREVGLEYENARYRFKQAVTWLGKRLKGARRDL
ncbi:MAG: sigma-70 family RNA polymerase sigma factor [Myxococcales bacterium]|nr:sigma-70 family RNA polymerase sigma factor [Myxococcales bacterium]